MRIRIHSPGTDNVIYNFFFKFLDDSKQALRTGNFVQPRLVKYSTYWTAGKEKLFEKDFFVVCQFFFLSFFYIFFDFSRIRSRLLSSASAPLKKVRLPNTDPNF